VISKNKERRGVEHVKEQEDQDVEKDWEEWFVQ
jgi:hypothetical protein